METKPLILERTYNAPIEKVWKAITDKDQMKEWYFELDEFKAEKGFKFQFTAATRTNNICMNVKYWYATRQINLVIPGPILSTITDILYLPGSFLKKKNLKHDSGSPMKAWKASLRKIQTSGEKASMAAGLISSTKRFLLL